MMTVILAQGLMQRWCVKAGDEGDKDEDEDDKDEDDADRHRRQLCVQ